MTTQAPATRTNAIVGMLALGGASSALVQTLVVPLLPQFPALLGASAADTTWLLTATLLVGALASPVAGRLADRFSKRAVLIGCLFPALAGAIICALSTSLWPVVFGRALQGLGMAVIPVGIAAMREYVPPSRLPTAVALMSSSLGVGGAIGLPAAAVMSETFEWQMLFWVTAGILAAIILAYAVVLPKHAIVQTDRPDAEPAGFDYAGAVLLGAGLTGLLLTITRLESWGPTSPMTAGAVIGSLLVLLLWGWWELRTPHPLVDVRLAANPTVLFTNFTAVLVGYAMYVQVLALPQLLTLPAGTGHGYGLSLVVMGVVVFPAGLAMPLVAPLGGSITRARGARVTLLLGGAGLVVGYVLMIASLGWLPGIVIASTVVGGGVGLAYGAIPTLIMGAVPHSESGSANSFNAVMRLLGLSLAATVTGAVLAASASEVDGVVVASRGGFVAVLAIACGVALAGAVLTWCIPRHRVVA